MAARRDVRLRGLISEAVTAAVNEHDKQMALVIPSGVPWPYLYNDKIAARVSREQGPIAASRARLLPFLLSHKFYELETELRKKGQSQYGYPLDFHKEMLRAISSHLNKISKIASKHGVPRKWFADYYAQGLKQLLPDASVAYPEVLKFQKRYRLSRRLKQKPYSKIRPHSLGVESQVDIFDAITAELGRRNERNSTLAFQLTALICSPRDCVTTRKLDPAPDSVRTNIRDRRKKP